MFEKLLVAAVRRSFCRWRRPRAVAGFTPAVLLSVRNPIEQSSVWVTILQKLRSALLVASPQAPPATSASPSGSSNKVSRGNGCDRDHDLNRVRDRSNPRIRCRRTAFCLTVQVSLGAKQSELHFIPQTLRYLPQPPPPHHLLPSLVRSWATPARSLAISGFVECAWSTLGSGSMLNDLGCNA